MQVPAAQTSVAAHVCPQPPQFDGSVSVVTQALPHRVQPGWQESAHIDAVHDEKPSVGGVHAWPHRPQLLWSLVVSVQTEEHIVPEHPQVPPAQVGNGAVPAWSHVEVQPPQYWGSLAKSTQRSVQSVSGGEQAETQPVVAQRLVGAAHATSQVVHDDGLDRLASQPSLGSWLQSAHPVSHEPMAHAPALQTGTACAIVGQAAQVVEPQP